MGKLHELLAVKGDLKGAFTRIVSECVGTFKNRANHFLGSVEHRDAFDADAVDVLGDTHQELVTTVDEKLNYAFKGFVEPYFDAVLQKEATNQVASAAIEISGVAVSEQLPATFLLGLETKLVDIRKMMEEIPTLQPGVAFDEDTNHEKSAGGTVYVTRHPVEKHWTKKEVRHKILVEPTQHHPAQIEKWNEMVPIGKITETMWSGMLSPAMKSIRLANLDKLIKAVKQARQRANTAETVDITVGEKLTNLIMGEQL